MNSAGTKYLTNPCGYCLQICTCCTGHGKHELSATFTNKQVAGFFPSKKTKQCYIEVAKLLVWIKLGHLVHIQKKLVCYHVVPWALFSGGLCVGNDWNPAPFRHSTFWELPPPRAFFHREPLTHPRSKPVSFLPRPHQSTGEFKHLSSADVLFIGPLHSLTTEIYLLTSHSPCWDTEFTRTGSVLL